MIIRLIKNGIRKILPMPFLKPVLFLYYISPKPQDIISIVTFLFKSYPKVSLFQKLFIIKQLFVISYAVDCPHIQHQIITFINAILSTPQDIKGCVVEAGSFKGGSTAKFSIAAKLVNRQLVVFDSFEGIPEHAEAPTKSIFGYDVSFSVGSLHGTLEEVKRNISRFGHLEVCEFIEGWYKDTMPKFSKSIAAIYLDVDLAESTRTCIKYLWPLLVHGGKLYSQDGDFQNVIDVFEDEEFWGKEVDCPKPYIKGLGKDKLIEIIKPIK